MSEKKIELIAQLLAKAESTTPEEAEALTAAAEKMMVKYGIEQAVIDAKRAKAGQASEKIIQTTITFNGAYRLEFISLGAAVMNSLGSLKALKSTQGNKSATLYIIGFESDVAQAELLIRSLQVQSMVAVRDWWKTNKASYAMDSSYDQEAARRSFVRGFGNGAADRIRNNKQEQVREAGAGTELVLVDRAAKVQAHFDSIPQSKNRSRGGKGDYSAQNSGVQAGRNANTGGRAMTQGRGISA